MKRTLAGRLNSRLVAAPDTACRLWTGCTNSRGYGVISDGGKRALVHRVAWQLEHGPIPDGMTIDHVWDRGCRYKTCALVAHLEPVTMTVNIQRSHRSNPRGPRGPVVTIDLTDDRLPPPPPPSAEAFAAAQLLDRLFASIKLPPGGKTSPRRIEQAEIDAFIERNRVKVTAVPKAQAS
jgi:HNH endonuclease